MILVLEMRCLAAAFVFVLAGSATAAELFRYRGAADDGGTLEYVFETDQRDVPATVTKDKVAEVAAEFMTTFYHKQIGALETQELRTAPTPFWLVCFSDTIKGPLHQLFFVVVMPDGTIIEPRVAKRLWTWAEDSTGRRRKNLDRRWQPFLPVQAERVEIERSRTGAYF